MEITDIIIEKVKYQLLKLQKMEENLRSGKDINEDTEDITREIERCEDQVRQVNAKREALYKEWRRI